MRPADLLRRSGVDQSVIGWWRDKRAKPTSDNVRKIAKAFGRDIREAILAFTSYTEEEIYGQVMKTDLTSVADEALLEEIGRRMRYERRRAASARVTARNGQTPPGQD
jgi:transcriptional regulator with XRE-family HTH domain